MAQKILDDQYEPVAPRPVQKAPTVKPAATTSGGGTKTSPIKYSIGSPVQARSADELAALYGIKNKEADYAATLGAATEAKFGMWDTQMKGVRDQQLTDYASQFGQYQNYQRQNRQSALRSGLNRGSSVAQEVMSQVQNQAYGAQNQTQYQQQLADIAAQKGAQVGADKFNAFDMANKTNMDLAGVSTQQQLNETNGQVGYLGYLGALAAANSTKYAADQNVVASQTGAYSNNQTYQNAIAAGLTPEQAARVANQETTITKESAANKLDTNGFPKAPAEGTMFKKGLIPYIYKNGKWVVSMSGGFDGYTGGTNGGAVKAAPGSNPYDFTGGF